MPSRSGPAADVIYVQIPAYRDAELAPTLLDLYAKARRPGRLRVRVEWQYGPGERLPAAVRALPGLELCGVPCHESRGCNWARSRLQKAWRGEPYTLLLDSHHRFAPGWDDALVGMYRALRARGVRRPLLTGYLPAYDPALEPRGRKRRPYKIYPHQREEGLLTRLTSFPILNHRALDAPVAADFVSLHFVFAAGRFNRDVPFDPDIYFFGDEVVTSLRAYTHGYDLFHPHVVVGWHCFDRASRVPHWADHEGWREQHRRSLDIMRAMYAGRYEGPFGPGRARSVREYEDFTSIDLIDDAGGANGQRAALR